jgi:tetratricopeptide (TPR) repeat protein
MVAARPDLWLGPRSLGAFYYKQKRIPQAQAAWSRSIQLAPRDATTLNNLGAVHYQNNEWPEARKMFQQAFDISPDCESCNNVATALYFDKKYEEASHYFEYAIQYCDTNDCSTWGNLAGALYWTKEGPDRARPVYAHAIRKARAAAEERPGDTNLVSYLIDYYVMSGDTASTRSMIAGADNTAMQDGRVLYSIGSAYELIGERDKALRYLALAVRHGFPLSIIELAPALDDLRKDAMYDEVVHKAAAAAGATAESHAH